MTSPAFVGRTAELAVLLEVAAAAARGRPSAVMVGGEAGVGKTRLVAELSSRSAPAGTTVLTGACFKVVDRALPYAPVAEALRNLVRGMRPYDLEALVGGGATELGRLLPDLGPPGAGGIDARGAGGIRAREGGGEPGPPEAGSSEDPGGQARLFEHLLGFLTRLGARRPVLLVVEDLHWSDRSTRDLLAFLLRNLGEARVGIVGTFRSDEMPRRHPLRSFLAETERSGLGRRLELERFDRAATAELMAGMLGREPEAELLDRVFERSEGNAFLSEELLAASLEGSDGPLPATLRDLLLVRIAPLGPEVQRVLGVLSVIGRRAEHRLLAAAAGLADQELLDALRSAVDAQVLTAGDGSYRFRHAMLCDAVYEDLLPGERVAMHASVAEAISRAPDLVEAGPAAVAAELACHWTSAHDPARGLAASAEAGRRAEEVRAPGDALAHYERALALWSRVPDPDRDAGCDRPHLLARAAETACQSGDYERAVRFAVEALGGVDDAASPVRAGLLRARLGRYLFHVGRLDDSLAEYRRAVDLVPADPPSAERAWALSTLGQSLMLAHRLRESVPWLTSAIAMARDAGDRTVEGHASNTLGVVHGFLGRREEAETLLREAGRIAAETGSVEDFCRYCTNLIGVLEIDGRYAEALALAEEGSEFARRNGIERSHGLWLRLDILFIRARLADWDAVAAEVDAIRETDVSGLARLQYLAARGLLALARGELDAAAEDICEAARQGREVGTPDFVAPTALAEVELALARRDPVAAVRAATDAAERLADLDDRILVWPLLASGMRAAADRAEAGRVAGDPAVEKAARADAERLARVVARAEAEPGRFGRATRPERLQIEAERERLVGGARPSAWKAVADARAALGQRGGEGYALLRAAEAYLHGGAAAEPAGGAAAPGAGDGVDGSAPEVARGLLVRAAEIASSSGEARLAGDVAALARRHRLRVGRRAGSPISAGAGTGDGGGAGGHGLSPREAEVLALVAEGRTNRQIAEELFISPKTASVHVSNILAKLGVANRGEAAALARRDGLAADGRTRG